MSGVQGYLAHKKTHPPRTLPQAYAQGPNGVLGKWAFSYGRGTLVGIQSVDAVSDHARLLKGVARIGSVTCDAFDCRMLLPAGRIDIRQTIFRALAWAWLWGFHPAEYS